MSIVDQVSRMIREHVAITGAQPSHIDMGAEAFGRLAGEIAEIVSREAPDDGEGQGAPKDGELIVWGVKVRRCEEGPA